MNCPCGMPRKPELTAVEWHTEHREHHIKAFPHIDQRTRENLTQLIIWAELAETKTGAWL